MLGLVSVPEQPSIRPGGSRSFGRIVSANGRFVVYVTGANHAAAGLDNNFFSPDVYRRDLVTGSTELVSVAPDGTAAGNARNPSISDDGCRIAFQTSTNLRPDLPEDLHDDQVYVRDLCASPPTVERVSVDNSGMAYSLPATAYAISGDGEHVLFGSLAKLSDAGTNCFTNDFALGCFYVRDLDTEHTARVDVATDGTPANNGGAFFSRPDISDHGRYLVFGSVATNLVANDTNEDDDAFVHDRDTDGNGIMDEPGGTSTVRISVTQGGDQITDTRFIGSTAIAGDGSVAAFDSYSTTLVGNDPDPNPLGQDVFVRNLTTGGLQRFGRVPGSVPPNAPPNTNCCGNGVAGISDDGSKLLFTGFANVPLPPPTLGLRAAANVYVADVHSGTSELIVDSNYDGDLHATGAGISGNGALAAFTSHGQLVAADTNDVVDVYAAGSLPPATSTTTSTTLATTTTTMPAPSCGDATGAAGLLAGSGRATATLTATDALRILQAAVGSFSCAECVCNVDGNGKITASDALLALRFAVGESVALNCPSC